jgi:hypothetical protein
VTIGLSLPALLRQVAAIGEGDGKPSKSVKKSKPRRAQFRLK